MILESQVRALDTSIQSLDKQITESTESLVNEPFKESWRSYTTRWQIQRDSWLGSGFTRKFGFNESRYNQFRDALLKWQADFQRRIKGEAVSPPKAQAPEPESSLFGGFFAGTGKLAWAALAIGGVWLFTKYRRR